MKPIPRFNRIILHIDNKYKYLMYPISKDQVNDIKQLFLTNSVFNIEIDIHTVYNSDIILFGKSNENSIRIENELAKLIKSKGGVLSIPSPIDLKTMTQGNKLIPGVTPYRVFQYNVYILGNPDNVIIFKVLL